MTHRVIALSDGEHREAARLLGSSRVRLVPNGFEPFEPLSKPEARRRLGLSPDIPVVGTTSRFTAQKAPMDIVEAFRVIHTARPDTRLLWINGGELQTVVEQRLADLGLLHATLRPGFTPDARTLLRGHGRLSAPGPLGGRALRRHGGHVGRRAGRGRASHRDQRSDNRRGHGTSGGRGRWTGRGARGPARVDRASVGSHHHAGGGRAACAGGRIATAWPAPPKPYTANSCRQN